MSGTGRKPRFVYEFRGDASLSTFRGLISASSVVAPTGFEPVFESRSRFRQVSYAVTDQQHPATSTRLKHAAESSLKHPEHDHVKREPGGPSPDERKLQNNFRTGAVEAAEREWYRPARRPTDRIIRRPDPRADRVRDFVGEIELGGGRLRADAKLQVHVRG